MLRFDHWFQEISRVVSNPSMLLAVHATAQMWPELNVVMFECICRIWFLFCHNHEKVVTGSNSSVPYVGLGLTATNEIMKQNTAD